MTDLDDSSDDDMDSGESSVNIIKQIAKAEVEKVRTMEWATVKAIYPHKDASDKQIYQCDVDLKNGGNELKNVSILTPHIGFSWIPNIGDQVLIGYIGGNSNSPVVIGSTYDVNNQPPVNDANSIIQKLPQGVQFKQKDLVGFEWDVSKLNVKIENDSDIQSSLYITDYNNGKLLLQFTCSKNHGLIDMVCKDRIALCVMSDVSDFIDITNRSANECILIIGEKNITIESKTQVTVKAPSINLEGENDVTITGHNINLKGSTINLVGDKVNIN
jgi:phage baseplate assembly protein gpV